MSKVSDWIGGGIVSMILSGLLSYLSGSIHVLAPVASEHPLEILIVMLFVASCGFVIGRFSCKRPCKRLLSDNTAHVASEQAHDIDGRIALNHAGIEVFTPEMASIALQIRDSMKPIDVEDLPPSVINSLKRSDGVFYDAPHRFWGMDTGPSGKVLLRQRWFDFIGQKDVHDRLERIAKGL